MAMNGKKRAKPTKNKKLAAMAAPKNKVTRRDVITAARRNANRRTKNA